MDKLITLQQKIAPEMIPLILCRYQILRSIRFLQPIGRRVLAEQMLMQERKIRNEVDFLRDQQLISCLSGGMQVTSEGEALLWEMEQYIRDLQGLSYLEDELAQLFAIKKVMVVPGDVDTDAAVKKDLARITANFLCQELNEGDILAVTGGTTLAEVGGVLINPPQMKRNITVIPARGGLGEEVEIQANTIAANIAKGLGANYRLLHVSDDLGIETMNTMASEPKIKEILELLHRANMILHGIGSAAEMARRRGMPVEKITELSKQGAVGEAFGYYFGLDGQVIYTTSSLGLQLGELMPPKRVVAVAGGKAKAVAVKAVLSNAPREILIIDEGAAREVLALSNC